MDISIVEIVYNIGMILLIFGGALVVTKTLSKKMDKKK